MFLELLEKRYGPTLNLEQIAEVMHLDVKYVRNMAARGTLPVPTYQNGKRHLATVTDVAKMFEPKT